MTPEQTAGGWVVHLKPSDSPRLRMVCFPHAGGGSTFFRPWISSLPDDVELCAVQPPGREDRLAEHPIRSIEEMVRELAPVLRADTTPTVYVGHSMGGYLALETISWLRERGRTLPVLLVVSAVRAPHLPLLRRPAHVLSDDEFVAHVLSIGSTRREVLENEAFRNRMLPLLRADVQAFETYTRHDRRSLDCPITALRATDDKAVSEDEVLAWQEWTSGAFRVHEFTGDHFFLRRSKDVVPVILEEVRLAQSSRTA